MIDNTFFDEMSEKSRAKVSIVSEYACAWTQAMVSALKGYPFRSHNKIAYMDLFSGPGMYDDGTKSTPMLILERAVSDPDMRGMLAAVFNDIDRDNCVSLRRNIDSIPGIELLSCPPEICQAEISNDLVSFFERWHFGPTLFVLDSWGYKDISLRLIRSLVKDWGCDCIFFFNYNRIHMSLSNPMAKESLDAFLGSSLASTLRSKLKHATSDQHESIVINATCRALERSGSIYVLPFRFTDDTGNRTSHYVFLVTRNPFSYELMQGIMSRNSSGVCDELPVFEFNPATVSDNACSLRYKKQPL